MVVKDIISLKFGSVAYAVDKKTSTKAGGTCVNPLLPIENASVGHDVHMSS